MLIKIRGVVASVCFFFWGWGGVLTRKENERPFWSDGNVLCLDLDFIYMDL